MTTCSTRASPRCPFLQVCTGTLLIRPIRPHDNVLNKRAPKVSAPSKDYRNFYFNRGVRKDVWRCSARPTRVIASVWLRFRILWCEIRTARFIHSESRRSLPFRHFVVQSKPGGFMPMLDFEALRTGKQDVPTNWGISDRHITIHRCTPRA